MKKEDYTIIIKADANDEVYWQMLRKGEPAACNEEEEKLAEEMLGEVFHKLEANAFGGNQSVKNLTKTSFAKIAVKAINRQAGLYFGFRQGIKFYIKKVLHYLESKYPKEQAGWELVKIINIDTE